MTTANKKKQMFVFDVALEGKIISLYAEVHIIAAVVAIILVGAISFLIGF